MNADGKIICEVETRNLQITVLVDVQAADECY